MEDVVRIRVELDAGQMTKAVQASGQAVNQVARQTREFFALERSELERLRNAWNARKQQYDALRQSLGLTANELRKLIQLHNEEERAAKRAAQAARAQATAAGQAIRNPGGFLMSGGGGGGLAGGLLGALMGNGGGGMLGGMAGTLAGAAGMSATGIGAVVAGVMAINKAIEVGMGLTQKWVEIWYEYRMTIERAKLGLGVLLGSFEKAGKFTQDLIKDLRGLGDLDSALVLSRRLLSVGVSADEARKKVKELVTIATGLGSSQIEQRGLAKALSDVATAGRLRGQEVLQFNNAGLNIRQILASSLKIPQNEVVKLQEEGRISARMVFDAITKEAEKYKPALEKAMMLPDVSINRIQQQLGRLGDELFGALFATFGAKLKELADLLENASGLEQALFNLSLKLASIGGELAGKSLSENLR
jgi:tape measure domain-containing protein